MDFAKWVFGGVVSPHTEDGFSRVEKPSKKISKCRKQAQYFSTQRQIIVSH